MPKQKLNQLITDAQKLKEQIKKQGVSVSEAEIVGFIRRLAAEPLSGTGFEKGHKAQTENSKLIRELQDSLRFNKNLISNLSEGLIIVDRELNIVLWNNFMEKLSQKSFKQVEGIHISEAITSFHELKLGPVISKVLSGERLDLESVTYFDQRINRNRYIKLSLSPNLDSRNNILGIIALVSDITQRTEYENDLKARNEQLEDLHEESKRLSEIYIKKNEECIAAQKRAEESDRLKSAFLANMSHEIRTPMNSILGFSQLLLKGDMEKEEQHEYLSILHRNSMQLLNLINDIIDLSKLEGGEMKINRNVMDLTALLIDMQQLFEANATRKGIELRLKHSLNDEEKIVSDLQRVRQIMTNLISNALKFTDEGYVEMRCHTDGNQLIFEVEDSGSGIAEEEQERIFERFKQASSNNKQESGSIRGGTGLGLAISKNLAVLLGGDIELKSSPGKGSVFTLKIPFIPENRYDVAGQFRMPDLKDKLRISGKILVAEDIESNFIFIKGLLSGMPIELVHARNGKEAVDYLELNNDIHLVLMDIKMPVMDGYEATRHIKKMKPDIPVIAQTAFAMQEDRDKAFEAGCDGYLPKPIKSADLIAFLRAFLSQDAG